MDLPTVAVIIRVYGPGGYGMYQAPVVAQLSRDISFRGAIIPATTVGETDEYGMCILRLFPNSRGDVESEYKFTITNPEGKRKILYAFIEHDCFLDDVGSENSGDWTDGGIGYPGGGNTGNAGIDAKITIGTTTPSPPGTLPRVLNRGTATDRIVDFVLPLPRDGAPGEPGLNGTGTIEVVETITGAPGTPALVENIGTPERQLLRITVPQGVPGNAVVIDPETGAEISPLPPGGDDGQLLVKVGNADGVSTWRAFDFGGAVLIDSYPWEVTGPVGPTEPTEPTQPGTDAGLSILDATTLAAYRAAIAGATVNNKRVAAAQAIIVAMGTAQRLTIKRNGVNVLVAQYAGAMTLYSAALNIGVSLSALQSVAPNPLPAADISTGTWTVEITGGAGFVRKITLALKTDYSAAPGMGFNPTKPLIIPRSLDGL